MKLKEAVKKAIKDFFQEHRKEILDAIRTSLKDLPVAIVYFESFEGYDAWCGDNQVIIAEREIVDPAYFIDIYHSGDINPDMDKVTDKPSKDILDKEYSGDIASFFTHYIGGEEKENKFYADLYKKEIREILKDFQYKKVGGVFYISKKSK